MTDRSRGRSLLALLAGVLLIGLLAGPALATDPISTSPSSTEDVQAQADGRVTARDLGLRAVAGFDGQVVRGRYVPVEVTIQPDRLVAGTLAVVSDSNGRRQAEVREVEVSAGAAKVYRFVTPPATALTVELTTDDADVRANAEGDRSNRYLVGVLGEQVPADVPPVRAPGFDATATLVAVEPDWLERGPTALDSLSALIVDATSLARLSDEARTTLATWVATGADLVVTVADGAVELGLPWSPATGAAAATAADADGTTVPLREIVPADGAWPLTVGEVLGGDDGTVAAASIAAGRGRVTVTGVSLGEGPLGSDGRLWGLVAPPHGATTRFDEGGAFTRILELAPQTLQTGGIDLPGLGGLAIFLVAYVLVVGPLNGFVLDRLGRRELAWGTIPAITAVFAIAAWVGAGATSPGVGLSGTTAWWIDDVGYETAVVGLRSPREGEHRIVLPGDAWAPAYATWGQPAEVDRAGGDTVLDLDLTALELGTVVASRPTEAAPPLSLEVTGRGDDSITVAVRNTGTVAVTDVQVRAGTVQTRVGDLGPGATAEAELRDIDRLRRRNAWEDDLIRGPDGIPKAPDSLEAVLRWQVLDLAPGIIWATGNIDGELPGGATHVADGQATASIGAFVAVGITPTPAATSAQPIDVSRELVLAGFGDAWRGTPWVVEGSLEAILRYRLPKVAGADTLVSTLDNGELFDGGMREQCFVVELRSPDGELLSASETCGDPDFPQPPPCPPGFSCGFNGDTVTLCDEEDECVDADVVVPNRPEIRGGGGLEIWDVTAQEWIAVPAAFDGDRAPADRFVNPLGEVLVRASGELHPFEFSGRGLGLEPATEASR